MKKKTQVVTVGKHTRYREMTLSRLILRSSAVNITILSALILVVTIIATMVYPDSFNFYTSGNLEVLTQQVPVMAIAAIGVGFLMISGEFDLSIAGIYTATPFAIAIASSHWKLALIPALIFGFACAALVGLVNSWVTLKLRVPSFVATLGMMFFLRGMVRWISIRPETGQPGAMKFKFGEGFHDFLAGQLVGPIYMQALWLLVIGAIATIILNRQAYGNHLFATGGDVEASEKTGIQTGKIKTWAFVICSVCAALAGVIQSARIGIASPATTLNGIELTSIAACVVGGVHLMGGRGTVLGMVLGATLLVIIEDLLVLLRAPGEYSPAFIGMILIVSVIFNSNVGAAKLRE
jgi:simple sugar transport system permease protein